MTPRQAHKASPGLKSAKVGTTWGPSRYLSPAEVAHHIRRSRAYVYQRISTGEIPAVKLDGVLRIPRDGFEKWLVEHTEPSSEPPSVQIQVA